MSQESQTQIMNPLLLEYIHCPQCHGGLQMVKTVSSTRLLCRGCNGQYPVERGVPILLANVSSEEAFTARNFGTQWELFTAQENLGEAFEHHLFNQYFMPVGPELLKDRVVLEAGCGYGRNLPQVLKYGAKAAIGFDISPAAFIAKSRGYDVVIGDIMNPPFRPQFDVVFTLGVIQHISNPLEGLTKLYELLKPGGLFHHSVYAKENNWLLVHGLTPLREKCLRYLPVSVKYGISWILGMSSYFLFSMLYRPFSWNPKTQAWASKHLLYYDFVLLFLRQLGLWPWILQVYDQINAPLADYFSGDSVAQWIEHFALNRPYCVLRNKTTWNFGGWK
jgi:SAM-dependent methyltransferase